MTQQRKSISRRGLIRATGTAGLLLPFRKLGGVAWAAETPKTYKKWIYAKPIENGKLTAAQFQLQELPMPQVPDGRALARIKVINIHAGTRNRMSNGRTKIGETDLSNYACAEIVQSRDPLFREGDIVATQAGWQDYQVISSLDESIGYGPANELVKALNRTQSHWSYIFRPVMVKMWNPAVLMDVFGTSGTTAYFGMRECGPIMPTDNVAVAGTTGSVGAMAAQIANAAGANVVGFGGGPERTKWVTDTLGIDKAIDYRAQDLDAQLKAAFPGGIDVFCDGVGGRLAESVAKLMNRGSRYFSYGDSASEYGEKTVETGDWQVSPTIEKIIRDRGIKIESWIVHVHYQDRIECEDNLSRLMMLKRLKPIHTVVDGIDNVPKGVMSQYDTNPYGKLQLRFSA